MSEERPAAQEWLTLTATVRPGPDFDPTNIDPLRLAEALTPFLGDGALIDSVAMTRRARREPHGHHDCPDGPDSHEDYCLNGRQE